MAKKTIPTPDNSVIITKEQLETLRDISTDLMNIRRTLEDLVGEDNLSVIMFKVGAMYNVADRAETIIDELVDSYEEDCDECDDNF